MGKAEADGHVSEATLRSSIDKASVDPQISLPQQMKFLGGHGPVCYSDFAKVMPDRVQKKYEKRKRQPSDQELWNDNASILMTDFTQVILNNVIIDDCRPLDPWAPIKTQEPHPDSESLRPNLINAVWVRSLGSKFYKQASKETDAQLAHLNKRHSDEVLYWVLNQSFSEEDIEKANICPNDDTSIVELRQRLKSLRELIGDKQGWPSTIGHADMPYFDSYGKTINSTEQKEYDEAFSIAMDIAARSNKINYQELEELLRNKTRQLSLEAIQIISNKRNFWSQAGFKAGQKERERQLAKQQA